MLDAAITVQYPPLAPHPVSENKPTHQKSTLLLTMFYAYNILFNFFLRKNNSIVGL